MNIYTSDKSKSISLQEVEKHNSKNDCWTVINGSVYDITSYIDQHPGTDEILKACGRDASILYATRNGIGHSSAADTILENFYLGELKK